MTARSYPEDDHHVMFRLEGAWLWLYPRDKLAEDATIVDDGRGFSGMTLARNVGSPAEVEAVFAHAISVGGRAVKPPQKVF